MLYCGLQLPVFRFKSCITLLAFYQFSLEISFYLVSVSLFKFHLSCMITNVMYIMRAELSISNIS